jgi:hypothetical protein
MAAWRRHLVRGAVLAAVGGIAAAIALAYQLTGSAAVRQQVTAQLRKFFIGGEVALGSARFRLLGGVHVENFTLYRKDDPTQTPLLHVPAGVIYHDKEQLAHGRLAIRKLLVQRPRITITRSADGRWNIAGILGPVNPELQLPVIEIEQATVVIEIGTHTANTPFRIELRNVNATLLNQPRLVLNIEAHGEAVELGPVHATATWHRTATRLDATVDMAPVPLTTAILRDLSRFCPGLADPVDQVAGVARFHAGLQYHSGAEPAWRHQVRAELTGGRLVHRDLPLPLDHIDCSARCDDDRVAIERFTAKAGAADVTLCCRLREPGGGKSAGPPPLPPVAGKTPHPATLIPAALDRVAGLDLTVKHLPINPQLFTRLPAVFQKYQQLYAPTGPLDMTVKLDRSAGPATLTAKLRPDGMAGRFEAFPYPVNQVRGRLDLTLTADRPPRLDVDLTAEANGRRPVTIQGRVEGEGPAPAYAITVAGDAIALDETLLGALPAKFQTVARSYHPQGRCDVTARLSRQAGQAVAAHRYTVGFRGDAAVCYDLFPVPLDRLSGGLDITLGPAAPVTSRGNWVCKFNDIRGGYAGARIVIDGSARPTDDGTQVNLTIVGGDVPLDDTLAAAFANPRMKLGPIWQMFRPSGRFDFRADVIHTDRQPIAAEYDIRVRHTGATIHPTFFPMELEELAGSFRLTPGKVEIDRYTTRHGPTHFDFGGGWVRFGPGWHFADLRTLRAAPLPIDAALVAALPQALQSVCHALEPTGTLSVDLDHLVIDHPSELPGPAKPPVIYWDGRFRFADVALRTGVAWTSVTGEVASVGRYRGQLLDGVRGHVALERATVFGQPVLGIHAAAEVPEDHPHELRLHLGRAQMFGGHLSGEAHVAFGAGLEYQVDLKAIGVRLEDVAKHNHFGGTTRMSGLAKAELYLTGTGDGVDELGGGGNVHVPAGKMYNLPVTLDLLKVIALHAPDGTAFEEAHAEFKIHGKRVQFERLDLMGSAVSLGGKGEMDLDGSDLAMNFYAVWGHVTQMLPPGLREIPPWLSKNLMLLEARGKLGGEVAVRPIPMPPLVDPVRKLVDQARGRQQGTKNPEAKVRAQQD